MTQLRIFMGFTLDPIILIESLGYVGLFSIVFAESGLFFGFFLPGDSLLFSAGLLASQHFLNIWALLVIVPIAAILGDNVGYWFGAKVGPAIFTKEDSFFFHKKHIDRTQKFYEKYGARAIILARLIPIVRTFTPILAGVGNMEYGKFLRFNILGGLAWSWGLTLLGYFLGSLIPGIEHYLLPASAAIIVLSFLPIVFELYKAKKK